tara:strand:- start:1836 stop:2066 length:231 start_codon:yes stop_codon:yes gene_type:complete
MANTNIVISKVKKENQYKGAYKRIFNILNKDSIFCERYEADESIGYKDGQYFLEIEGSLNWDEEEKISKIKNLIIL